MSQQEPQDFENIVARIEAIANKLEAGDSKLEDALSLFEEGVRLSKLANERLDQAEQRLEVLLGNGQIQPLDPGPQP